MYSSQKVEDFKEISLNPSICSITIRVDQILRSNDSIFPKDYKIRSIISTKSLITWYDV